MLRTYYTNNGNVLVFLPVMSFFFFTISLVLSVESDLIKKKFHVLNVGDLYLK